MNFTKEFVARIDLTPKEIIFNEPHPMIGLRLMDRQVRIGVHTLVQEIKRDIIYRRMQLKQPQRMEVPSLRIRAHVLSAIRKLIALLEYQGIVQNKEPIRFMPILCDMLLSHIP
jgi:hypothetical protein